MGAPPRVLTEGDWLACTEPAEMFRRLAGVISARKLRLFAAACCRHVWDLLADARSRRAVEVAERFAAGKAGAAELAVARRAAQDFLDEYTHRYDFPWPIARTNTNDPLEMAATAAWGCALDDALDAARASARHSRSRAFCSTSSVSTQRATLGKPLSILRARCSIRLHMRRISSSRAALSPARIRSSQTWSCLVCGRDSDIVRLPLSGNRVCEYARMKARCR